MWSPGAWDLPAGSRLFVTSTSFGCGYEWEGRISGVNSVVFLAIAQMLLVNPMSRVNRQSPLRPAKQRQVLADPDAALVEQHVVVGAQAEDVVRAIGPVVWGPERPDVGGLRVGTR